MPTVQFQRPDYLALRRQWDVIKHCLEGEFSVKMQREIYLPAPNPSDISVENKLRYDNYLARAVFYNVTRRTISGLVGLVFQREPMLELPSEMEAIETNADGGGVNLVQIAKDCLWNALAYGKTGILVDYPHADKPLSIAEQKAQEIGPTLSVYNPRNIINWRTAVIGGKKKLVMVVLEETEIVLNDADEFDMHDRTQYRVLRLRDGIYTQQLYRNEGTDVGPILTPLDANGNPFNEIPFFPVGSETNTLDPTAPPAYDLATINIAHFRNSADYEESCYIVGQPTLLLTGLTEQWVKEVYGGGAVEMGSRAAISMPVGGDGKILQAEPNGLVKEAMEAKEAQMVALGARLVQDNGGAEKTATEARYDQSNADSVLANCAQNVNDGIIHALEFAARFTGSTSKIVFKLNTEFDLTKLSAEDIKSVIGAWQANAIATSEMRAVLARGGMATLTDDEFKKEISEDVSLAAENAAVMMEATTPEPEPVAE